jgi:hypothetical protein
MSDPTTIETEIVNPDLFDIANMEWEEYVPGESPKNTNTAEETPIKQLMNFQHYRKISKVIEPMEVQPINTTATNKKEQQVEKSKSTAKKEDPTDLTRLSKCRNCWILLLSKAYLLDKLALQWELL